MNKKILLFFHAGSLNRGCEAIVRTAIAEIKKIQPSAQIDLASFRPETDEVISHLVRHIFIQKSELLKLLK